MLKIDREDYLKSIKGSLRPFAYKDTNDINIKIYGQKIRTFDDLNRVLIINSLIEIRPDFFLINECNIGLTKFKVQGYNIELSRNQKIGIIYTNIYYLNACFKNLEDDYTIIRMVNTNKGNFSIISIYTTW